MTLYAIVGMVEMHALLKRENKRKKQEAIRECAAKKIQASYRRLVHDRRVEALRTNVVRLKVAVRAFARIGRLKDEIEHAKRLRTFLIGSLAKDGDTGPERREIRKAIRMYLSKIKLVQRRWRATLQTRKARVEILRWRVERMAAKGTENQEKSLQIAPQGRRRVSSSMFESVIDIPVVRRTIRVDVMEGAHPSRSIKEIIESSPLLITRYVLYKYVVALQKMEIKDARSSMRRRMMSQRGHEMDWTVAGKCAMF
ncbi:hypothetical protein FOL47_002959 [Perkinsus chesapeaki]|uniref:Uncharacterized protein n=1 Tax=Perkinsus chesapeaki TaxID=330153 RepID=A0A7J6MBH0_PERCH|nr:hypothetical protein FOL47_002959 [Perkinsus chesapeaki]